MIAARHALLMPLDIFAFIVKNILFCAVRVVICVTFVEHGYPQRDSLEGAVCLVTRASAYSRCRARRGASGRACAT